MRVVAALIVGSHGWRRRSIALSAGAFGALAMAPLDLAPALVVTLVVAVWLLDACMADHPSPHRIWPGVRPLRIAFGVGWWLGFGYFLAGFWWLGSAFIIEPEFLWALPLGIVGLPMLLAFFTGFGFVVARILWSPGAARVLALALGLGAAEWARGHLFTGFPWNSFGMGLGGDLVSAQVASLVGLDGLNILTIAIFAMPATLTDAPDASSPSPSWYPIPRRFRSWRSRSWRSTSWRSTSWRRRPWHPTGAAVLVLAAIFAFGGLRLFSGHAGAEAGIRVRIMQPGIKPDEKFSYENRNEIVARYIALSKQDDPKTGAGLSDVDLLVWPESAFPFILARDPEALNAIGAMLPAKTTLVTGAAREATLPRDLGQPPRSVYYNDIMMIGAGGVILGSYDKIHLVPFGEYLPFESILRRIGLHNFVAIPGGFEPGTKRAALHVPRLPAAVPLICYEAIFPGEVGVDVGTEAPRFILNVTNDGWFGLTSGPSQHFAQVRLRTIEEGLPMIRGAGTGISAIIDPYGRVISSLPLGADGILDGRLPKPSSPTVFSRHPTVALIVVCFGTVLIWLLLRRRVHAHERGMASVKARTGDF